MARKTKEELNKIDEEFIDKGFKKTVKSTNKNKTAAKSKSAVKSAVKKEPTKKVKTTSKKEPVKKVASSSKKEPVKKVTTSSKKEPVKKAKTSSKEEATKKIATSKSTKKTTTKSKDESAKKVVTAPKKESIRKVTSKENKKTESKPKAVAKKTKTTKKSSTTTRKKATAKKSEAKSKVISLNPIEYYDLPYRYNETVVKVLAQNPNTLFVYWDISDNDRENLEKQYGKLFFYNTRPVLVVHNLTDNYTFEIDIDDFANNWYVNVNDTKCKYFVELGRRPKYDNHNAIPVNYLKVASSNMIEMPNDHILFFKDNDKIYFRNIKTNKVTEKIFKSKTYSSKLKGIYSNYNLSEKDDRFDFQNPSSQNPTSNVL